MKIKVPVMTNDFISNLHVYNIKGNTIIIKCQENVNWETSVFPLTQDDDGQFCVCVTVGNHNNSVKEAGLRN